MLPLIVQAKIDDEEILVISKSGMASSVDKRKICEFKDVLAAAAYSRVVNQRQLDFELKDDVIVGMQTHPTWNMLSVAIEGELKGSRLRQLGRGVYFSFVWLDFYPNSEIFNRKLSDL